MRPTGAARAYGSSQCPMRSGGAHRSTFENFINEAVLLGLHPREIKVTVDVPGDVVAGLARRLHEDIRQKILHMADFARLNLDVRRLTSGAAHRLVNHDARVRQGEA